MVYTADLVGLLRTLVIIFLVFWGFRILGRYVIPLIGRWAIRRAGQRMQDQAKSYQKRGNSGEQVLRDDGEIKISKSKPRSDDGEFVDFEEIE